MISVTLVTNNPRKTVNVRETMTIREILDDNKISLNNASVSINGFTLGSPIDLDKQIQEHTDRDTATIAVLVNKDNAAQAIVMASACVIKSTLTPEEIRNIKKLRPEMLEMVDEDGEPVFAIDIDENIPGTLNKYGACFGNAVSEDGKATITVVIDPAAEDPAKLVEEQFGHALLMLAEMEEAIAEEMPNLKAEERKIKAMISRL